MPKKPHAKGAKDAKAKPDEGFGIPDFYSPLSERMYQSKKPSPSRSLRTWREARFSQLTGFG
jgi:hypothetical protein